VGSSGKKETSFGFSLYGAFASSSMLSAAASDWVEGLSERRAVRDCSPSPALLPPCFDHFAFAPPNSLLLLQLNSSAPSSTHVAPASPPAPSSPPVQPFVRLISSRLSLAQPVMDSRIGGIKGHIDPLSTSRRVGTSAGDVDESGGTLFGPFVPGARLRRRRGTG
jgi:hypothetical protein